MKRKLLLLLSSMVLLITIGTVFIYLVIPKSVSSVDMQREPLQVVTTFYPMYLIGINVADHIDGIEVKSLTDMNTGCLHDYQLTTEDMKSISNADVLIINGGGMEGFLEDIKANYPNLTIIDASQSISMLKYQVNSKAGSILNADNITKNVEHVIGAYNPHVWLNPKLYEKQIDNVRDGLINYINNQTSYNKDYRAKLVQQLKMNTKTYNEAVQKLDKDMQESLVKLISDNTANGNEAQAVIFHDSFSYIADRIGIKVAFTVPLDSDTSLSAGDIAVVIDAIKQQNIKYLFTEQQFSKSIAKQIEAETNAKVYIIDSVVTGNGAKDSYIKAMRKNIEVIKSALNII